MTIRIDGGRIVRALPCFQTAPFDEDRRDRLRILSDTELHLNSATTRVGSYGEDPTKSVVVEFDADADAVLSVQMKTPSEQTISAKLSDLAVDNVIEFTGVFTSESLLIHRLVGPGESSARVRWNDRRSDTDSVDWYYVRVTEQNGQMAWSSPIWVG